MKVNYDYAFEIIFFIAKSLKMWDLSKKIFEWELFRGAACPFLPDVKKKLYWIEILGIYIYISYRVNNAL